ALNSVCYFFRFDPLLNILLFEFRYCKSVCCITVSCILTFWRRASLIFGEGVIKLFEKGIKCKLYVVDSYPLSLLDRRLATMAFFSARPFKAVMTACWLSPVPLSSTSPSRVMMPLQI